MRQKQNYSIKPPRAGFSRATVRESGQGFCVKAVRKPAGCVTPLPVQESPAGIRPPWQNIRTIADWSSSQNNINNAWIQNFSDGRQNNNNKNNTNSVRAIRGFTQKQKGRETFPKEPQVRKAPMVAGKHNVFRRPFFGNIYAV